MGKVYHYIGPHNLRQLVSQPTDRMQILQPGDVIAWIDKSQQEVEHDHFITATFIVDTRGHLWVADRRSEHVVCAAGQPVLTAGEITFVVQGEHVIVSEVTNQSTGYCPEPETWPEVDTVLDRIGLEHPPAFTTSYIFRCCDQCGTRNIVKEDVFICGVCDAMLSLDWNF